MTVSQVNYNLSFPASMTRETALNGVVKELHHAMDRCLLDPLQRANLLLQLLAALRARYEHIGNQADLVEMITLLREARQAYLTDDLRRQAGLDDFSVSLALFAHILQTREQQFGDTVGEDRAIELFREVLLLCPPGHINRAPMLINFAAVLNTKEQRSDETAFLDEAIALLREALVCSPGFHPVNRRACLRNLGVNLEIR